MKTDFQVEHASMILFGDEANEEEKAQAKEWEGLLASRKYALIVDEAHSSQTGETARELKQILGSATNGTNDEDADWEEKDQAGHRAIARPAQEGGRRLVVGALHDGRPGSGTVRWRAHRHCA